MNTSVIKTFFCSRKFRQLRFGALGALVSAVLLTPTTALGWNYSNVPLFWVQGIKPNVALMLDDSGSMQGITTNEAFQRANVAGTVPTTEWYWCTAYSGGKCTSYSTSKISDGFTVLAWNPPSQALSNFTVNRAWSEDDDGVRDCTDTSNGFMMNNISGTPNSTSNYTATGICKANHGYKNGDTIKYISKPATGATNLSTTTTYYVVNVENDGFRLATTAGGTATTFTITLGTTGSFAFTRAETGLAQYISGTSGNNVALCNVSQAPGSTNFYVGKTGTVSALATASLPTVSNVGVLVSDQSSSGAHYACARWKMASTGSSSVAGTAAGYDYVRYTTGTLYDMDSNAPYGNFLLNTLVATSGSASVNFDNNTTFPISDKTGRDWDATKDKPVSASGAATDNKYYIIPNVTRVEAAREASQKIVLDFYDKLNIGLFHLNTSPRLIYAVPDGSNPTGAKEALISTTESMLPADLPASAIDGYIGESGASGGTPLALTQGDINSYFKGTYVSGTTSYSSPIQYRCQKNYAVVMTDGEPSSDTGTLDAQTQTGYDTDIKTTGNDTDGKSWDDSTDSDKWKIQNIVTYTVGLGLEANVLKRAPLVNQIKVPKSNINIGNNNTIKLDKHGFTTGDYVQVVSNAAGGLKSTNYYYVVVVDADNFKLAGVRTSSTDTGDSGTSITNNRKAVNNCVGGTNATTNGALGCMVVTNNAGSDMVLSTGPGKSFFSFTPDQLAADMGKVFNNINKITSSASAVSTNTKQFGGGGSGKELVYQARFNTEDWSGEVAAYEVKITGGKASVDTSDTAIPFWTTKKTLANASKRKAGKMFTWNPTTPVGVSFDWNSLSAAQQTALGGATVGANVISWLQGNNVSGFRQHSIDRGLMGDILGADPVFFNYANASYSNIAASLGSCTIASDNKSASGTGCTGAEIYSQYVADGKANRTPMIYVGANDGMLHALDALSGEEMMTFIPNAVYTDGAEKKFLNLTSPSYDHRYYVDGSASVSDAFDGNKWHSYLLFGLGHGGKSVSAIDVTDTTYVASDIKWEFSNTELGYTYGTPVVARFANNKWYAIFPNGLDSASNKASVFVVNIDNAADVHLLTTGVGSAGTPNGMMSVQPQLNSERTVTNIYAGDIRGNVWKFDVYDEGSNSVQWNNGDKLFTTGAASTGTPQSITGGIRVGKHPTSGVGSIIYFGTGKYFEVGDNTYNGASVPQVDSLYAVLDNGTTGLTRGQLKKQTFTMLGANLRTASQDPVNYSSSEMGWYIDLLDGTTKRGERIVSTPLLSGGRVIFASIIPSAGATCGGEGSSYLNELDALTGGMLNDKVLDTNGDGKIDGSDQQVSSVQLGGLISDPSIVGGQDRDYKVIGSTSAGGSVQILSETKTGSSDENGIPKGRVSWQQLQ